MNTSCNDCTFLLGTSFMMNSGAIGHCGFMVINSIPGTAFMGSLNTNLRLAVTVHSTC